MPASYHTPWPVRIAVLVVIISWCVGTFSAAQAVADPAAQGTLYVPLIVVGTRITAPTPAPTDPMPTAPVRQYLEAVAPQDWITQAAADAERAYQHPHGTSV